MTAVRRIDPASDADVAIGARLMTEVWREALGPDEPPTEVAEVETWWRHPAADAEVLGWFVVDDAGEPVGLAVLEARTGRGNDDRAWVTDLWVRPTERRRGLGRLLADAVVEAARERGRTTLSHGHQWPHEGAEGFAAALGCVPELVDDQNRLVVADLDRAVLESWAVVPDGYSVVAFDIPCPDDLLDDFVRVQDVMNTAPRSETENPSITTAAIVRDSERRLSSRSIERWVVAVRHDGSGELVGYTELVLEPYKRWLGRQGDTAVAVPHRGHGLGRVLKAVNALRLLDERPEVTHVETWNAASNEHMLAINHAMGFRRVSQWRSVELCT